MVRADIVCTEQPQFKTNCEVLWVKIEVTGVHPLFVCAFYSPEGSQEDYNELHKSVAEVKKKAKGNNYLASWRFQSPKSHMARKHSHI